MSATSGKQLPIGLRYAVVYALDANGRPAAVNTTVYEGLEIKGPKAFTLTLPDPRQISHMGNDRVLAVDILPPTEPTRGELRASVNDFAVHALLTGTSVITLGEATEIAHNTDKQGSEPQVGLLLYQMSLSVGDGLRHYRCFVIPLAVCIPKPQGMSENPEDVTYIVNPTLSNERLWGAQLVLATDGITEASIFEYMCEGKPKLVAFKADGTEDEFLFPTGAPAKSTAKISVFKNGVLMSAGITKATTKVTFTSAPTLNDNITVFYEV
jgi:hypothetical protein